MARQVINRGNFPNDHAHADPIYVINGKLNDMTADIYSRLSQTISVGEARFSAGATTEARGDLAIAQALAELASYVEWPAFMLPYDITLMNQANLTAFHALGGRMTREGGDPSVYDVWAYGAAGDAIRNDQPAWQVAVNAPVGGFGGKVYAPAGAYRFASGLTLPISYPLMIEGEFQGLTGNLGAGGRQGTILLADFDGTLVSQTGTLTDSRGIRMSHIALYGNDRAVDLLKLDGFLLQVQLDNVYCRATTGYGIFAAGVQNSWARHCRVLHCGDSTHAAIRLDGSSLGLTSYFDFTGCHLETNTGIPLYITNEGRPAGFGCEVINFMGGKIEQNNGIGPVMRVNGCSSLQIRTHLTVGGGPITGIEINPTDKNMVRGVLIDSIFYQPSASAGVNPQYYVDVQNGREMVIRGIFFRGGANNTAQIRVPAQTTSTAARIYVDPSNVYCEPLAGSVPISGIPAGPMGVSADIGNGSTTLWPGISPRVTRYATAITADRTVTLGTTNGGLMFAYEGCTYRIVREATCTGAFNVNVGSGPLKALGTAGSWCDVSFDGTTWRLEAYGLL